MAGLLSGACSAAAAAVSVWANACLATCSLLVYGRMPRRFYTPAAAGDRLWAAASHALSYAAVLAVAVLVGAACAARALLRRVVRGGPAPPPERLLRGLPPSRWLEHSSVKIRNIKLHYVSAGRRSRRLVLFLHGFPEFWYSWKEQLREFAKTEWVVALDLPGYGDSDGPRRSAQYSPDRLTPLLQEFIASLGRQQCVLVGSGHGALLGWHLVASAPHTFTDFISISQPLPHITLDVLHNSLHHKAKQWRTFLYQLPWLPEQLIGTGDLDVLTHEYGDLVKRGRMSADDLRAYQFAFSRAEDWHGPLNHQRCLFAAANGRPPPGRLAVPCLLLFGRRDGSLPVDAMYRSLPHLQQADVRLVDDAGRHIHIERPDQVNDALRDFIGVSFLDDSSEDEEDGDGLAPAAGRGLVVRALEGGQGWLGAGGAIYNRAMQRLNNAAAVGQLYTRSVMMLKD
ncbi:epoxide hydrolase 4-like [Amphibalanus amphitrite]|uniref:epoxide hydrolase 4-like n=1 Tax=Amphibalanus amphitrite TaxID=1232801 RepID=UPI001C90334D|nr:epoxide hydrolase 4-like [Amphibalanus amphitrite]